MLIIASDPANVAVRVFWQGVPLTGVVAVDTEECWADRVIADDAGRIVVSDDGTGPAIERIRGGITVEFTATP